MTLILRLVQVFPDIQSRKTQRKQAELQPQIDKLKEKYANDPQRLQKEQSKLMRENGVGCLAGCLPMLLTLPLFFCFLAAFRFWGYEQTVKLSYETIVDKEQAQETFDSYRFLWITNIWQPDSGFAPVVTEAKTVATYGSNASLFSCGNNSKPSKIGNLVLFQTGYTDSRGNVVTGKQIWDTFVEYGIASGEFESENMQLCNTEEAQTKYNELMQTYKKGHNNGWFVLPLLAAGFQFLLTWITQRQQKKNNPQASKDPKQNMNFMMWLFPIMSIVFCMTATSAFSLYWVLSSVLQIGSNQIINYFMNRNQKPAEIVAK